MERAEETRGSSALFQAPSLLRPPESKMDNHAVMLQFFDLWPVCVNRPEKPDPAGPDLPVNPIGPELVAEGLLTGFQAAAEPWL